MLARLETIERQLSRLARAVALVGLAALLLIAALTVADVLGRWLASAPITGTMDVTQVAVVVVVASCFPAGVLHRQHISIRFVGEWLGPRATAWLDAFGAVVLLLVLAGIAWQFIVYTAEIIDQNQHTWIIELDYAPWWVVGTALFLSSVVLQLLVVMTEMVRAAAAGRAPVLRR